MPPLKVKNSQPTLTMAPQQQGRINLAPNPGQRPLQLSVSTPQAQVAQAPQPTISIPKGPPPISAFNDNAGLQTNLQHFDSYSTNDQVKLLQRASKGGLFNAQQKAQAGQYIQQALTQQNAQDQAAHPPKFSWGEKLVGGIIGTGQRAYNTVGAGVAGLETLGQYGVQKAMGNNAGAQRTLNAGNQEIDQYLNSKDIMGGRGAYLTPEQASSSGGGWQGLKENFIKPTAQAVGEIAPLVVPGGLELEGLSLPGRVAVNAGVGAGINASSDAVLQYANGQKYNPLETLQSAGLGAAMGGGGSLLSEGGRLINRAAANGRVPLNESGFIRVTDRGENIEPGESVVHLSQDKNTYARLTPDQQKFMTNETGNIPFDANDRPHLSAATDTFMGTGRKEVSLADLRQQSPNLDAALRKYEASVQGIADKVPRARAAGADDAAIQDILENGAGSNRSQNLRDIERNQGNMTDEQRLAAANGDTGQAGLMMSADRREQLMAQMHEMAQQNNMVRVADEAPVSIADNPRATVRDELPPEPQGVDYSRVDGAGQEYKQAVKDRYDQLREEQAGQRAMTQKTDLFDQIRSSGGIGQADHEIPNFLKRKGALGMDRVAQELGFADDQALKDAIDKEVDVRQKLKDRGPGQTAAQLRAAAEDHVANHPDFADLRKRVAAEQELQAYADADKASGYTRNKFKQTDKGRKSGMTSAQIEKVQSPEYAAKKAAGDFLTRVRDELGPLRDMIKAYDKQRANLGRKSDVNGIRDLNAQNADALLRMRYLEGLEKKYSAEYKRTATALDDAYPDTALYRNGKAPRNTVKIGDTPATSNAVRVGDRPLLETQDTSSYPTPTADAIDGHPGITTPPVTGDMLDAKSFENVFGVPYDEGLHTDGLGGGSYSPMEDSFIRDKVDDLQPRNLAGDEAAFNAILDGRSLQEAADAYVNATGASADEAAQAVNLMAETGEGMGTQESVLKRNPYYGKVQEAPVRNATEAAQQAQSYGRVLDFDTKRLNKQFNRLSDNDKQLADSLRGNSIDDVAAAAENPEAFRAFAEGAKDLTDYIHEIKRLNGDDTIYRQNYGAGMHFDIQTEADQQLVSEMRSNLANTPGWSNGRHFNSYDEIAKQFDGIQPKNANFMQDLEQDAKQAKYYTGQRSLVRTLNDAYPPESVAFGQPSRSASTQLRGYQDVFTTPEIAKTINKLTPNYDRGSILWKPYDAASSLATQAIVLNPLFHGANQLVQSFIAAGKIADMGFQGGPLGGLHLFKSMTEELSPTDMANWTRDYLQNRGHIPSYGARSDTFMANLTKGLSNINRNAMSGIEARLRVGLYKASIEGGMAPEDAVRNIDHYLGDSNTFGSGVQRGTLFLHYFKTMGGALAGHVLHPVENAGATVNALVAGAAVYGLSQGYSELTGNQDAYVRAPGELGLVKELYSTAQDIRKQHYREATSILTNRVNPILKEGVQQLTGRDLFTGQQIDNRGQHLVQGTLSPAQLAMQNTSGKKSLAEQGTNQLGLYTPHAKGYQASSKITVLNTPNAKEGNGKLGQTAYFDSLEDATRGLNANDKKRFDAITASENDDAGNKIGSNDQQAQAKNLELAANPRVLAAITKQKQEYAAKTGEKLDPLYSNDVTPEQRATYLRIQGTPYKSDDYTRLSNDNQDWLKPLQQARADYFNGVDFSQAPPSERVQAPQFDAQTQADFNTVDNLSGAEKAQFIANHPNLQNAYDQIAKYTNDRRKAQGYDPYNMYPDAPADVQKTIDTYNALPKGDGPKGGNATRSAWIKNNQAAYNKMNDYFTKVGVYELAANAGQAKYEGSGFTQKDLKNIYNLGQYDIVKGKDANGNAAYAYASDVNGSTNSFNSGGTDFYVQGSSSNGYGSSNKSNGYYTPYRAIKQQTYFTRFKAGRISKGKTHKVRVRSSGKVKVANAAKNSKIKVT